MDCEKAQMMASARLDGELDASELLALEKHLEGCPSCRRASEEMKKLQGLLGNFSAQAPRLDSERVWRKMEASFELPRPHLSFFQWTLRLAATLLAAALIFSFWTDSRPAPETMAKAKPLSQEELLSARLVESVMIKGGQSQEDIMAQVCANNVLNALLPSQGVAQ